MSKKKQSPPVPRCALCKGAINLPDSNYVEGTTGKMVCRDCLQTSFHLLEAPDASTEVAAPALTPQRIIQELDKAIIGQEKAKEAVALAVWKQMLRANGDATVPRTNLLLYGPADAARPPLSERR